jgi:hypothetical protein
MDGSPFGWYHKRVGARPANTQPVGHRLRGSHRTRQTTASADFTTTAAQARVGANQLRLDYAARIAQSHHAARCPASHEACHATLMSNPAWRLVWTAVHSQTVQAVAAEVKLGGGDMGLKNRCQHTRKAVLVAALLIACNAGLATAQTTYFRDEHGRTTGRAEQRGDTTYFRDEHGRTVGRAEQQGDVTRYRDSYGRTTGRAEERGGTTQFRDDHGRGTGRAEQRGTTTYFRDEQGRSTGRAEQRGSTTYYRDQYGRTTGRSERR